MSGFDVFLSHNSNDKPTIRELKQALANRGLSCWLDEEQLRPGLPGQEQMEQAIKDSDSVAVFVGPNGPGPWQNQEMRAALRLAVKDGRPIIPVLLPEAPSELDLPLFLVDRIWVDLRGGLDARGIDKLIWGITGNKPGMVSAQVSSGGEIPTPSDTRFLDEIFDLLYTHPALILLAQEGREQGPSLEALHERAKIRFGSAQTLYLVPSYNTDISEAEFFRVLTRRAGMGPPAESAVEFDEYLDKRLIDGERLFLLITDLSKCSDTGRERLAGILRGLSDVHGDALRMVLVGGKGLAELKYAQGDLSLLTHAELLYWPELNIGDLMVLARQGRPRLDLTSEEAQDILKVTGGHPRLIQEALWCRAQDTALETCIRNLAGIRQIESQLIPLSLVSENAQRIADWLGQDDLGPYRGWIQDPLLRRLYWKNLLRAEGPTGSERLVWRCQAIIEAGQRVLGGR